MDEIMRETLEVILTDCALEFREGNDNAIQEYMKHLMEMFDGGKESFVILDRARWERVLAFVQAYDADKRIENLDNLERFCVYRDPDDLVAKARCRIEPGDLDPVGEETP